MHDQCMTSQTRIRETHRRLCDRLSGADWLQAARTRERTGELAAVGGRAVPQSSLDRRGEFGHAVIRHQQGLGERRRSRRPRRGRRALSGARQGGGLRRPYVAHVRQRRTARRERARPRSRHRAGRASRSPRRDARCEFLEFGARVGRLLPGGSGSDRQRRPVLLLRSRLTVVPRRTALVSTRSDSSLALGSCERHARCPTG